MAARTKPTDVALLTELANQGLKTRGGTAQYSREEFLPQLRGPRAMKVYREMVDNTGTVGGMMLAIEMLLRQVSWHWEPKDETPAAQEAADFVSSCWDDMSTSVSDLIIDVVTMLPFGFSAFEIVYKRRQGPDGEHASDFDDGRLGWRKIVLIPQDTVSEFIVDETGGLAGIKQGSGMSSIIIPVDKTAVFRTRHDSFWGKSVLRSAYPSWLRRKRIEEIEAIGIERDLAGLPLAYLAPEILADSAKRTEYANIVKNIRNDEQAGVVFPAIFDDDGNRLAELTLLGSPGTRVFDTTTIINRYTRDMAISVLQDMLILGHEKIGTQALASEKRDLSDVALTAWLDEVSAVFTTHVVPRLLWLNGLPPRSAPALCHSSLKDDDLTEIAQWLSDLSSAGFVLAGDPEVEDWVRRVFGLPLVTE